MSMLRRASVGLLILFCANLSTQARCAPPEDPAPGTPAQAATIVRMLVASTDLTGSDPELGIFLTDTVITDLSHSQQITPLEGATVRESMSHLHITADRALSAADVRRLGTETEAARVLVGSFLIREDQIIINARMLDSRTGLVIPGGATSVTGSKKDILQAAHTLSRRLHKQLTGEELVIEESPVVNVPTPDKPAVLIEKHAQPAVDDIQILKAHGLIPGNARANADISEAELTALIGQLSNYAATHQDKVITASQSSGPVTRIRALAALVKLVVAAEDIANFKLAPPDKMPADTAQTPLWGVPYLAAAVDQNWWPASRPIAAKEPATWAFVAALLTRMPLQNPQSADSAKKIDTVADLDQEPYTGLVIDALDFKLERAMGPRILDDTGALLYPDPSHIPGDEYIQDRGMVSYYGSLQEAKRAGKHPLVIRAIRVSEVGHDDITVSHEAAELIREANRRGKFLWKWNVAILTAKPLTPDPAPAPTPPPAPIQP